MKRNMLVAACIALTVSGIVAAPAAEAGPYGRRWQSAYHFHYDQAGWRGGRWVQSWHGGRYGWWYLVGATWLLYPAPLYPYPDPSDEPVYVIDDSAQPATVAPGTAMPPPPPTQAAQAATPPGQVWYYCNSPQGYYPYVSACPSGWQTVAATPPDMH